MAKTEQSISFFERFKMDILAQKKTITLRDASESHFKVGQVLNVMALETGKHFCDIKVERTTNIAFDALTYRHAKQENMTLNQLKSLIQDIYPGIRTLFMIEFSLIGSS
ncbi:N(4)-acetylcytidine aminohydrolase [uncultured Shewanella sp.]|uniref:N(4)-acetylcytidine aminohydrolase n=1 Tax=uncultured Shewanella sp. TaxID=173975 RepID=UPI002618EFBA|nr:N(4)-acetylcytidine aminohydrolase [uncultured Shewanella sp.]